MDDNRKRDLSMLDELRAGIKILRDGVPELGTDGEKISRALVGLDGLIQKITYQRRLRSASEPEVQLAYKPRPKPIKPRFLGTPEEVALQEKLDPSLEWDIPNAEFPREMSSADVTAMLATKCSRSPSTFWRNRADVEGWLIGKGIKLVGSSNTTGSVK